MKINRYGQSKILTPQEIELLFNQGLTNERDRTLFAVCLFSACRIAEACTLLTEDVYNRAGEVRSVLIVRKSNTKGKLATRNIPVLEDLRIILKAYRKLAGRIYLFPGRYCGYLHPDTAARFLREACDRIGIEGVSTHSFRRTALTQMSNAGIPLRIIQEISGHRNLEQLQRYLEVHPNQVTGAIASLSMLSPIGKDTFTDPADQNLDLSSMTDEMPKKTAPKYEL
ncbi:MAG TPA: integrase [Cyanobacteria bacterium UBA11369]|nr:integrase [Cyanobacteria bacterium UBA11371]HBE36139.1 integrase [Cyanobacteria bacterium UBA11368]HBE49056.1 integrase [Cyanobacteria bacterium UBA11369]